MAIRKGFLLIVLCTLWGFVQAQDCFNYHKEMCQFENSKFSYQYNEQSVSYLFKSGMVRAIPFNLYEGKDYRFLICADAVFDDVISMKIAKTDGTLIYDNSTFNYNLNLEFSNKKSQAVEILIEAPAPSNGISDTVYYEGCIGLLIEEMISVKTGF